MHIVSADESDKAVDSALRSNGYDINDFYVYRSIGLWGCFAKQEQDLKTNEHIIYFLELYQLNKKAETTNKVPNTMTIILIWHYDTKGNRNTTPQFMFRIDKFARDVRSELLSGITTIPSGRKIRMLPMATTWEHAHQIMKKYMTE